MIRCEMAGRRHFPTRGHRSTRGRLFERRRPLASSSTMPPFPSAEWAAHFQKALNDNPAYARAAAAWEGDILFEVIADAQAAKGPGIYLDLSHGVCKEARFVTDTATVNPEFVFRSTRENWQRILRRELDPVKAFLGGTIKMSGNPAKILRFVGAAKELIDTAAGVPRDD